MIRPSPLRTTLLLLGPALALALAAVPAEARRHAKPAPDAGDTGDSDQGARGKADKTADKSKKGADKSGQPTELGQFGDWRAAFYTKGKTKTCYTLASPKESKPAAKRQAYVFISNVPADKIRNQISIAMGYTVKETAKSEAKIGSTSFDLFAQGGNTWIKDTAEESKFVDALKHGGKLVVKASPTRGAATTDTYVLTGLKQALDRIAKECR